MNTMIGKAIPILINPHLTSKTIAWTTNRTQSSKAITINANLLDSFIFTPRSELTVLPVRLRHAADHLAEHENPVHFVFLDRVPGCITLVV